MAQKTYLFAKVDKKFLERINKRYKKLTGKLFSERGIEFSRVEIEVAQNDWLVIKNLHSIPDCSIDKILKKLGSVQ